jgi:hypothetical protein
VKKKGELKARTAQVAQDLPVARLRQIVGRFHLDHQPLVDDHVDALEADHFSFVMDLDPNLSGDSMAALE